MNSKDNSKYASNIIYSLSKIGVRYSLWMAYFGGYQFFGFKKNNTIVGFKIRGHNISFIIHDKNHYCKRRNFLVGVIFVLFHALVFFTKITPM